MEFRLSLFFLSLYYLRPQDWVPGLTGVNVVKPVMAVWMVVLFAARSRPSPMPGLLRTPHDWAILVYFGYVVWNAPEAQAAFTDFLSLAAFYALTVQSLTTWDQLHRYLRWWNLMLLAVAVMALLSVVGIDPTGARDLTEHNADRLCLGTWLLSNPNSLGHTVIAALPLSYLLFFWKGSAAGRFIFFPICFLVAGACAWLTESKGAFLVGGALIVLVFVIGRHKIVQITALTIAATVGITALSFLPRMSEMSNLRADEGVIGRIMAWEQARTVTRNLPTGEGFRQFRALIDWQDGARFYQDIPKATHSSYVQIGGDLGIYGIFIYLAAIWAALHTLLFFQSGNDHEERCRRAILVLVLAYLMSGWMINRQYHTEYFLLIAAAAAMHRLRKGDEYALLDALSSDPEPDDGKEPAPPPGRPARSPRPSAPASPPPGRLPSPSRHPFHPRADDLPAIPKRLWNRFGVIDVAAAGVMTWAVFWFWDFVLKSL